MTDPKSPNFLTCPAVPELEAPEAFKPAPREEPVPAKPPRNKNRRQLWRLVLIGCLGLGFILLILVSPLLYGGARAARGAFAAKDALTRVQAHLQGREFSQALSAVDEAQAGLDEVRAGLSATGPWRSMPWIGTRLRALEDVEQAGSSAVAGAKELIEIAVTIESALATEGIIDVGTQVAPSRSFKDLSKEEKRSILSHLSNSLPKMREARERIAIAADAWEQIPKDELFAPARAALEPLVDRLPELRDQIDASVSLVEVLLPLAGYPDQKTYLILLQNADELRPGGGFIGTVGEVVVDAADFESIDFKDVYSVDDPVADTWNERPPEIMQRELGVRAWFLRDANWSPDFTQSAERVMDFYEREIKQGTNRDVHLDAVISLHPQFFTDLLKITGPLVVEGKTFTADNFYDELQYDVEIGFLSAGIPVPQRKEVVAKIGDALLEKLTSQPASNWPTIATTVTKALHRKDMMIYSRDADFQHVLDAREWSGRTKAAADDYLMVVDANLAALKTDGVMDKRITYTLDARDPSNVTAKVLLHYVNTNHTIDWRYTRYRSYTRIYVPEGSEFISSSGAMAKDLNESGGRFIPGSVDVMKDLGKTVFGAFWAIEPGKTGELSFTYRLPSEVGRKIAEEAKYELLVQKQAGSEARLTLDLAFGKKLQQAAPGEDPSQFNDEFYRINDWALPEGDQLFSTHF